jgi:hypothetical protein
MRRIVLALEVNHRLIEVEERRVHRDSFETVDPEFVRVTTRVLAIGFIVLTVGTVALYLAFRAFGDQGERSGATGLRMLLGAVALILVFCLVLLRWSVVRQ